jgi:TolB-like protein/Tfp pilus assembly protein PilF
MSFIEELKRRNVVRVGIAYVVAAWLILQVSDIVLDNIAAPEWLMQGIMLVLAIGLPIALIFAWAFELTPEGIKKERDVDRSQSITQHTGRKLDFTIIAILAIALAWFAYDKFGPNSPDVIPDSTSIIPAQAGIQPSSNEANNVVRSIAVLPFVDMSPAKDNEYFTDGLTEELLNILAQIKSLQVAGRTSSFAFKGKTEDLREIGEKLNVNTLLEGSVRKDDKSQKIRVTVQLINVEDGYHIWSDTYDRDLEDIFAIQEDIARQVADALKINLLGEAAAPIAEHARTAMSAYDLYLQGLKDLNLYTFESLRNAETLLNQSLAIDADYLPTKIALVRALNDMAETGAMPATAAALKAEPLLAEILSVEPNNADALAYRGQIQQLNRLPGDARLSYEQALALNPRQATALRELGAMLMSRGHTMDGMEYLQRASAVDPYDIKIQWALCSAKAFMGDDAGSERECGRIGEIQPGNPMEQYGRAYYYQFQRQWPKYIEFTIKAIAADPKDPELPAGIALAWIELGDMKQAEYWTRQAEQLAPEQIYTVRARTTLLVQQEQYQQAVDLAQRAFDKGLQHRIGATAEVVSVLVNNAVQRRAYDHAMQLMSSLLPGGVESPIQLEHPNDAFLLAKMAKIAELQNPGSPDATTWLDHAEMLDRQSDNKWVPSMAPLKQAYIAAACNETSEAVKHLRAAFDAGWPNDWRTILHHDFLFEPLQNEPEFKELIALYDADMEKQREDAYELLGIAP